MVEIEGLEGGWIVNQQGNVEYAQLGPVNDTYFKSFQDASKASSYGLKKPSHLALWNYYSSRAPSVQKPREVVRDATDTYRSYNRESIMISEGVAIGIPELTLDLATEGAFSLLKNTRLIKSIANSQIALKTAGTFKGALNGTYKIFSELPLNQKIGLRESLAKNWGLEMEYVDFNKPVYTETLEEGTVLIQYRLKGYEGTKGKYYALPGTKPEQIGLRTEDIGETQMVITKGQQKVIISTHKENLAPYYDKAGKPLEGGGKQIKSDNLSFEVNSNFKKID